MWDWICEKIYIYFDRKKRNKEWKVRVAEEQRWDRIFNCLSGISDYHKDQYK
jgi:hypothetical protein